MERFCEHSIDLIRPSLSGLSVIFKTVAALRIFSAGRRALVDSYAKPIRLGPNSLRASKTSASSSAVDIRAMLKSSRTRATPASDSNRRVDARYFLLNLSTPCERTSSGVMLTSTTLSGTLIDWRARRRSDQYLSNRSKGQITARKMHSRKEMTDWRKNCLSLVTLLLFARFPRI